jgi:hypothetical protein
MEKKTHRSLAEIADYVNREAERRVAEILRKSREAE